ncbi:MAG: hypothetical protein OEV42_05740 [Deltaproteobacteria bacterium]|nr:hypothetical protein [Deltaproteobacteria bacterium]
MPGFFKRKQRKEFEINCPVCSREFIYKHDPREITNYDYKYKEGAAFVCSLECDFCHAEASVVQYRSGKLDTFDNKWVKLEKEHTCEIDAVRSEIASMKEGLEKKADNQLTSQLVELEARLKKLEHIFNLQVKKYTQFQEKWRDDWQNEMLKNT